MARQRSSGGRKRAGVARDRRTSTAENNDEVPQVYQQMLSEASPSASSLQVPDGRPPKRRRVGERGSMLPSSSEEVVQEEAKPIQTAYDLDASEESEVDWEDVDLEPAPSALASIAQTSRTDKAADEGTLQITLGQQVEKDKKKVTGRRKPITALEKKWRLDIHKVHLLCLLGHVRLRNAWCNDVEVQVHKPIILFKIVISHYV